VEALQYNTTGSYNTAVGLAALYTNSTGQFNTGTGNYALEFNTTGSGNTATGASALQSNTTGSGNTAQGSSALFYNTTGNYDTAFGASALWQNSTGSDNAAHGAGALQTNTTGSRNTAVGNYALNLNSSGSYNTALGYNAGYNETTGHDNIYVANLGGASESQTMRLGSQGAVGVVGSGVTKAFVAGITSSIVTGSAVYVTPHGQLGVLASAERYKTDVASMGATTEKLGRLRPVTFKLKNDPQRTVQYGLIAEEVDRVYPELVIRGAEGRIEGVRYEELAPILLNEIQQQRKQIAALTDQLREMQSHLTESAGQAVAWQARGSGAARTRPAHRE
jgi:hypothetical protein